MSRQVLAQKICVVTGTRAEYGLLEPLIRLIHEDPGITLQLVVTGSHLEDRFGHTVGEIEDDGYPIARRVPLHLSGNSTIETASATGRSVGLLAEAFAELTPDIIVLLGDRYEIFGAAAAAMILRIPIAHIHGGEATEGLIDEAIRHSVSKMAQIHFAAAEEYRNRIIQLGECPERVFNVGALFLDRLQKNDIMSRQQLGEAISFPVGQKFFLLTWHPETLKDEDPALAVNAMMTALDDFPDHRILITGVNADPGHDDVHKAFSTHQERHPERIFMHPSLGQRRYFAALVYCAAVIGNSSSGILEAPAFGVPTINIGDRQRKRVRAASVIDCAGDAVSIARAIKKALDPGFKETASRAAYPFGEPGAAERILHVLKQTDLKDILVKSFYDLPVEA